jgi:copper chaperone NosL
MGAAEAVPFSTEEAAKAFAGDHGGDIVRFDAVPRDYILEQQPGAGDASVPSREVH